jgi:hypothetical protein
VPDPYTVKECSKAPSDAYADLDVFHNCPLFARKFREGTVAAVQELLDKVWVI